MVPALLLATQAYDASVRYVPKMVRNRMPQRVEGVHGPLLEASGIGVDSCRPWPAKAGRPVGVFLALLSALACHAPPDAPDLAQFNGSWVLESDSGPMALQISGSGGPDMAGSIVGAVGGRTQPFVESQIVDGRLRFRVERTFDGGTVVGSDTVAWFDGGTMRGETVRDDQGDARSWSARRPDVVSVVDSGQLTAGEPVSLFDGSGLSEWNTGVPGQVEGWVVENGILRNVGRAPEVVSNRDFWDFRLQVQYRVSEGGNSGIALRGRYEVQILDDFGAEPSIHGNGAIYSRIKPALVSSRHHSEWQEFDIRLVGRVVTVSVNGATVIDRKEIEGITAMARDAHESRPGPIALQGDHGPIEFRRVLVTPLERR